MVESFTIAALALSYVSALFALAWVADRRVRSRREGDSRPFVYALSLAVYCTSWTFFGSVGLATATGYDFIAVYLGPILLFVFGWRVLLRIVRLAKSQNITSVADFLASRYGKSQAVAAIVTVIAVAGTLPYIALQLKAVASSVDTLIGASGPEQWRLPIDTALIIAGAMAVFAILFGTRHVDATEHQEGLIAAVAAESIVKLFAFLTVGFFVLYYYFGGIGAFLTRAQESPDVRAVFGQGFNGGTWITVTFLSLVSSILLPRQFHVAVVENNSEGEIRRARWLFPLYLVLINLFVVPIAVAGMLAFAPGTTDADMFVLGLPLLAGAQPVTLIAFVGGLSAATAMVIVDCVALAIMVCNGLVVPLLLQRRLGALSAQPQDFGHHLLNIRRFAIVGILMLAYIFYRALGQTHGLASIGLVSFAAIAQFAPAFIGGLLWRNATARGAIAGILAGFFIWAYTLLLPWIVEAGWLSKDILTNGPFGLGFLSPRALFYLRFEPLTHGVLWSIAANVAAFVTVSLLRAPEPVERLQARIFVLNDTPRPPLTPSFRLWRTSVTAGDVQRTIARYLGAERAARSFAESAETRKTEINLETEADLHLLRFAEHLLTSAIGAASSRLVLSLLLKRGDAGSQSALRLLDDASEALQYNRDLLQSALDQVRHGLSVFDNDLRLICWNRQFRELLNLPPELGRVGTPLEQVLRICATRGDFGPGNVDMLIVDRMQKLAHAHETFQEQVDGGRRVLEIRTSPMPQGGFVTTYSDITERVEAAAALERSNETLERRVRERTAELLEVNKALAIAKREADEANQDKTRFLAAASHDVMQPLNAARLYVTSLVERQLPGPDAQVVANVDASLEAVEEILNVLIEIARLDTGKLEPEITKFALQGVFDRLAVEFEPLARSRGLALKIRPTPLWIASDRRMLYRLLQNFVSNAIKYTTHGGVLLGARAREGQVRICVYDTGPGIQESERAVIFREFHRLDATARSVRGLGLGLSIVERSSKLLGHNVELSSVPGRGSMFAVEATRAEPSARAEAQPAPPAVVGRLAGVRVLCIDNERTVLQGMRTLISGWGCEVATAQSAEEAVLLCEEGRGTWDIVLADYHLDRGIGLEAIMAVRGALGRSVPAVIISADNSPEMQRQVRAHGHHFLRKPVKAAALRALMYQLTLNRATAAE